MSKTTIYRCDICGDESTKARDWERDTHVETRWGNHSGATEEYCSHFDICPNCANRIKEAFGEAWKKVTTR